MNKAKGFLFKASVVLAFSITLSCSSNEIEGGGSSSSIEGGGQGGGSSSSVGSGKGNDIGNYETVVIGTQTWMAENLNYAVEGSKCYGDGGFRSVGDYGIWWSADEYSSGSGYRRIMRYHSDGVDGFNADKYFLYSVRCVQD